jgi:hypothetical protein
VLSEHQTDVSRRVYLPQGLDLQVKDEQEGERRVHRILVPCCHDMYDPSMRVWGSPGKLMG